MLATGYSQLLAQEELTEANRRRIKTIEFTDGMIKAFSSSDYESSDIRIEEPPQSIKCQTYSQAEFYNFGLGI